MERRPVTAFERVLAEPGSLAARHALAAEWKAAGDPRATLIEQQLAQRELALAGKMDDAARAGREIDELIARHGRAFAGPIADLVDGFQFFRGLVARVTLRGAQWQVRAAELLRLAPIQHLKLTAPLGDLDALFGMPELLRLRSLNLPSQQKAFGDRGAIALARSPHVTNLRFLDLGGDAIGQAGIEAIAASPYLAQAAFIHFTGNPADPTPWANVLDRDFGRPALAAELEHTFGKRPWLAVPDGELPPSYDELAVTT